MDFEKKKKNKNPLQALQMPMNSAWGDRISAGRFLDHDMAYGQLS